MQSIGLHVTATVDQSNIKWIRTLLFLPLRSSHFSVRFSKDFSIHFTIFLRLYNYYVDFWLPPRNVRPHWLNVGAT